MRELHTLTDDKIYNTLIVDSRFNKIKKLNAELNLTRTAQPDFPTLDTPVSTDATPPAKFFYSSPQTNYIINYH